MTDGLTRGQKGRNWCFTINNPSMEPAALLQEFEDKHIKYGVFQKEKGNSGTPHYQGYIELANNSRFSFVKKLLGGTAHIERRHGTAQQARDYCIKDDGRLEGPFEYGLFTAPKPGKRTDLQDAVAELAEHRSLLELANNYGSTFIRYHKGFASYLQVTAPRREHPPRVCLYYGGTGTGKTRKAMVENPDYFRKHPDSKWFDGYISQSCLLLDDFVGAASKMSLSFMLQLIDRYPFTLEIKGGYTELLSSKIIITTNNHPNTWYDYAKRQEQYRALKRRFQEVWVFDQNGYFRVDRDKFFGDTSYETPEDYRVIALTRPVALKRTQNFVDLTEELGLTKKSMIFPDLSQDIEDEQSTLDFTPDSFGSQMSESLSDLEDYSLDSEEEEEAPVKQPPKKRARTIPAKKVVLFKKPRQTKLKF